MIIAVVMQLPYFEIWPLFILVEALLLIHKQAYGKYKPNFFNHFFQMLVLEKHWLAINGKYL